MKTHRFAFASALLLAPAALAGEGGAGLTPQPVGGQAVATDVSPAITDEGSSVGGASGCCDPCNRCFWAYGEYLYWRQKGDQTPPLLSARTTIPGGPTTTQSFGGGLNDDYRNGYRVGIGFYPHLGCRDQGVEVNWFSLGDHKNGETITASPSVLVTRPFTNVVSPTNNELLVGGGNTGVAGGASFEHESRFEGGNIGLRRRLGGSGGGCEGSCTRCFEFLYGYQYYHLDESLDIRTNQRFGTEVPRTISAVESFDAENQYHGGYLGFAGEFNCGKWFVGATGKAGIGYLREQTTVEGTTSVTTLGQTVTRPFGTLLAQPSNSGRRTDDDFTWSGELGVRAGWQPLCWLRTYVGYNFIYIDRVTRPGGLIDTNVNLGQTAGAPNPAQPIYNPHHDSFWAHGLTAGVEIKF